MDQAAESRWIGLIGGLGVGSTIHYYRELVKAHEARGKVARLLIAHADMARVLQAARADDRAGMAAYLAGLVRRLAAGGAQVAAVSAVMPHMCIRELTAISPIPLVNVVQETAREIRRRGFRRVSLFGARFVVESRMFGQLEDIDIVMPSAEEIAEIHDTYFQMANAAAGTEQQFETLRHTAHTLMERGAEAIVFAGTDPSLVFNEDNTDFPHVDCAKIHTEAIVR